MQYVEQIFEGIWKNVWQFNFIRHTETRIIRLTGFRGVHAASRDLFAECYPWGKTRDFSWSLRLIIFTAFRVPQLPSLNFKKKVINYPSSADKIRQCMRERWDKCFERYIQKFRFDLWSKRKGKMTSPGSDYVIYNTVRKFRGSAPQDLTSNGSLICPSEWIWINQEQKKHYKI